MSDLNVRLKITTDTAQAEKSLMTATQRTKAWQQATDDLSQSSSLATQAVQQGTQALDKNGNRIHAADVALGRFVDKQGKMREANGRFVKGLSETDKALGKVGKSAQQAAVGINAFVLAAKSAKLASSVMVGARGAAVGLAGSLVSLAAVAAVPFTLMASSAIKANSELNNLSTSLSINRETLQTWMVAAEPFQVTGDKLADIFKNIQEKAGDFAATGGGEGKDVFERLKLNIHELLKLSPDEALLEIYRAIEKIDDISQQEKIFLLESLADDSSKLIPLLENNAQKLKEIDRLAAQSGAIISPEQQVILNKANHELHETRVLLKGLKNDSAIFGAELINTFSDDLQAGILSFRAGLAELPHDFEAAASAWDYALGDWAEEAEEPLNNFLQLAENKLDHYANLTRLAFTYTPVYARAAYDSAGSIITAWQAEANAVYERYKQSVLGAMIVTVESSRGAAVTVSNVWGTAIGWVIDRFADLVSGAVSMLEPINSLAEFAGFEPVTLGAENAVAGIRALANESRNSGQVVASAFDGALAGLRDAQMESEAAEAGYIAIADAARETAKSAFEAADAFVENAETERKLSLEMQKAEKQFEALESNLNKTGKATKQFRVNQEAVNDALGKGEKKTKKLKEAKSEAEKAAEKLAKAQQQEIASLQDTYRKLTLNEQAYYAASEKIKLFDKDVAKLAKSLHYQNTLVAAQNQLVAEQAGLSPKITAKLEFDLGKQGLNPADIAQLASQKIAIEHTKIIQQSTQDQGELQAALNGTEEAFKRSTLQAMGFTQAEINEQIALDNSIKLLEKKKETLEASQSAYESELASLKEQEIKLRQGDAALYDHQLKLKKVSETRRNELLRLRQQNEAYEAQEKYLEKVNEKLAALKLERDKIGQNAKTAFELDLEAEGFKPDDITALTQEKMAGEFEKVKQALQEQRQQLTLTAKDYRNLGLELEGFDAKQRAFITGFEAQNERMKSWQDTANTAFDAVGQNLTQVALTGKADWKGMIDELIKATFELTIIQPFINSLKDSFKATGYSGSGAGGFFGSLISSFFANGGAFAGGQQVNAFATGGAFTNTVVSQPTPFSFNGGELGVMGEAGPEAIVPLHKASDGDLGVKADIVAKAPPVFINMPPPPPISIVKAARSGTASKPVNNITIHNTGREKITAHVEHSEPNHQGGFDFDISVNAIEAKIVENMESNNSPITRVYDNRYLRRKK